MDTCDHDPTVKDYLTVQNSPTLTNSYGQEPLESHGCYNQRIMEHCRPEHDYRRQQFTHSVLHPSPACSVIPWMSP